MFFLNIKFNQFCRVPKGCEDNTRVDGASRHAPVVQWSSTLAFQNFFQNLEKQSFSRLANLFARIQ
jgi:hypothetical protein